MREIKLRAWDKRQKQMSSPFSLVDLIRYEHIFEIKFKYLARFNDLIWLKYTGLKDKNEVECYDDSLVSLFGAIWQIVWDTYYVCYMLHRVKGEHIMKEIPGWNIRNSEVIGDIHSTPELLEG